MNQNPGAEIKIRRTITLTTTEKVENYADEDGNDMTIEQVIAYEHGRSKNEKIEAFMEGLEYSTENQIELTEEITNASE